MDAIVNKVNELPKEWEPDDLEPVIDDDTEFLCKEANRAYTEFYLEAKRRGIDIFTISAYRSKKTQERNWNNAMNFTGEEYTTKYIAYPGRSEHQLGLTVDISYTTYGDPLTEAVADSQIGKFIVEQAHNYGFIPRYPREKVNITNYEYEPWHIRYVGVKLATELHEKGLALEEYHELQKLK